VNPEGTDEILEPDRRGGKKDRRGRRAARRRRREAWNLNFESVGTRIPASVVAKSPTLLMAAVEEVCLRVQMDDCLAHRPRRWRRRAYAAWSAQLADLEQIRGQLRTMVDAELLSC
jgi:hypothetical protein